RRLIQRVAGSPAHDLGTDLMELYANLAGHKALRTGNVRVEVTTVGRKPLALVDESRVLLRDRGLEMGHPGVEDELVEGATRRVQADGRRAVVYRARCDGGERAL